MIETTTHPQTGTTQSPRRPRVALAHDWLCGRRGGEAVLERLALLVERDFEPAGLFVMFDDGRALSPAVDRLRERSMVVSSSLSRAPMSGSLRRWMLPLYPRAVAGLGHSLRAAHEREPVDLVISSSSAAIKGLCAPAGVPHLCYCHSPARYVWSRMEEYGAGTPGAGAGPLARLRGTGLRWYGAKFRDWDKQTAAGVTRFVANSTHTAAEILRCYGRESSVVFPPVRTGYFTPDDSVKREKFWLVVSALEPYKRVDLAVDAARLAGADLVVAGAGSQRGPLERRGGAKFVGRVDDAALRDLYRRAAVLIFPQVEDFGIVAAEAQACGLPVVARRAGGALDIVEENRTGAFFDEPAAAAVADAVARAPAANAAACRESATRFSEAAFDSGMAKEIGAVMSARS